MCPAFGGGGGGGGGVVKVLAAAKLCKCSTWKFVSVCSSLFSTLKVLYHFVFFLFVGF